MIRAKKCPVPAAVIGAAQPFLFPHEGLCRGTEPVRGLRFCGAQRAHKHGQDRGREKLRFLPVCLSL